MQNCENCGFKKWWKTNAYETVIRGEEKVKVRMWRCCRCGYVQAESPPFTRQTPKILYFDIETALMNVDIFNLFVPGKYISWRNIRQKSFVVSWAAGWVGKRGIQSAALTPHEARTGNDRRILWILRNLMDLADFTAGHNNKVFDEKFVNYRFLKNNIPAPLSHKSVDTLSMARKYFKNASNALEHWSLDLGADAKDDMNIEDWKLVSNGDAAAIRKMERYNRGDVRNGMIVLKRFTDWLESGGVKVYR